VARHFPDVTVVRLGANRGAVARNVGVDQVRTPYVAFADDDSWWAPGALGLAATYLTGSPRLGLLAARVLVGEEERLDEVTIAQASAPLGYAPDLPGPSVLGFLACGVVVRRDAFLQAGGYDSVVHMYGEETRLAWDLRSAGWGLAYVDDVVAHHHPSNAPRPAHVAVTLERNRVLTALMRRPWPVVAREVMRCLSSRSGRVGLYAALPRTGRALSRRRTLGASVEEEIRALENHVPSAHRHAASAAGYREPETRTERHRSGQGHAARS
jgi:GT2 family glycosyltransferase